MENKLTSHAFLPHRRNYTCKQESQALLKDTRGKTKFCVINLNHGHSYKADCMCLQYPFGIIWNWDGGGGRMHRHRYSLLSLQVAQPYSDTSSADEFKDQARTGGVKRKSFHASSQILFLPELTLCSKRSYSQWPESISCPGLPPVAGDASVCHMSSGTDPSPSGPARGRDS